MAEILAHPWLETATPGIIYVPAPPVTELAQPLPSALHIDRDLFESLCVIWGRHANFEAIKADLLSPAGQGTLAKAFYFLLHKHRERTMEEHGILMDVTDALNGSSGKVVTKQYSAPRARAKTLQITGRDSYAAVTGHRHHRQHMDPYNQHHRYAPQQQQSHLRSSRPAPVAPSGSRSRSRSRSPSPAPPTSPGLRQPVSVLPPMERVPSRPYPHPPSPAGPRPQRPRPTSSPPATLLTRGRPDFLSGPGNGPNSSGMRSTGAAGGSSHVHGHLPYRRMLPPMERTAAMMSSPGPSHATSTDPNTTAAAMSSLTVGTGPGTGMTLPRASIVSGPTATPYNSAIVSPQQPQLVQNQRVNPTGSTPVNVNPAATLSPPVIHAPIPVQATVAMSMGNGVGVVGGSGNGVVLPMIAAPRVQDEALQRTINYCASLVNGQAVSWNAIVAKEIEREREREKEKKEGRHEQAQVMMNEEFAKSRVALGDSLGSQVPSQSQLQQQHDEKMDVDTPKKGEDKENWDQQVSPTGIATASAAAAPAQSESGGLGFGSSVPMGREMGNTLNAEEGGGNVTPPKGKGKDGKTRREFSPTFHVSSIFSYVLMRSMVALTAPALDFTTPPGNMSSKKLPNFSSLIGSPTSNANAIPMSPPPHSSTTAMLLGSPVVGEFKGWFSNLFHWKPHSFILHSVDDINETKREVVRLLEASGVAISFTGTFEDSSQPGQSQTPQLQQAQQEGWAPLKCRVDELYEGNSILQKQVKFKVEFSVGAGLGLAPGTGSFVGSPRNISSPMSPLASPLPYTPNTSSGPPSLSNLPISLPIPIPNRTKMNSTGMSIGLGQGENSPMQVVVALTLEKGALSGFKNVCTFLRSEWRLDGGLMVPVSPRSPKFGIMSGGSVNTSIEQRMLG